MLKALKKKLKDQRGLTLVELLAVVVILGIISAIAVPSIGGIIEKTKKDAQVAEALQIINAAKLAHASNSTVISWTHTELGDMVENVKDDSDDYTVTYVPTSKTYKISDHPGVEIVAKADSTIVDTASEVTEASLLKYTGN